MRMIQNSLTSVSRQMGSREEWRISHEDLQAAENINIPT
jgi:hypothetical protein